jgi:hypothetical protein
MRVLTTGHRRLQLDGSDLYPGADCPATWNSCDGPYKRHYRSEDNYTAWLKKRKARRGEPVAPQPAGAPVL